MLKHIGRTGRNVALLSLFAALAAVGVVGARLLLAGPIPIPWAVPFIEQALHDSGGITEALEISDLSLLWDPDTRRVEFAAENLRLADAAKTLTAVERVNITLSALALLEGKLQVKDIVLIAPHLHLTLPDKPAPTPTAPMTVLSPENIAALSHLHGLVIQQGMIELQHGTDGPRDLLTGVQMNWERRADAADGLFFGSLRLAEDPAPRPVRITLHQDKTGLQISAHVTDIWVDSIQNILNGVAPDILPLSLKRLQMPVTMDGTVDLNTQGAVQRIGGTVSAGMGHVILPELYDTALPVQNLKITGDYDAASGDWKITDLRAVIFDEDGPIPLALQARGSDQGNTIKVAVSLKNLGTAAMKRWWPAGIAPGAAVWVRQNLQSGRLPRVTASVALSRDDQQNYTVTTAKGGFDLQNAVTTFMPGFPPVTGINGAAVMDADTLHFDLKSGQLGDLKLQPSTIDIDGLRADIQNAKLFVPAAGPLSTVLKLIDTPPYGYAKKYGLNAAAAHGDAALQLQFELPLLAALKLSDLKYHTAANLNRVYLPGAVLGKDITNGQGFLELDPTHLKMDGGAALAGVPIQVSWEDFAAARDGVTRLVNFSSDLQDGDHAKLGLPTAGYVTGPAKLTGTYETQRGQNTLRAKMDLAAAKVDIHELNYAKPAGAPLIVNASVGMGSANNTNNLALTAAGQNMALDGAGVLDANMNPQKLNFGVFRFGDHTNAQVQFEAQPAHQHWTITGQSFDAGGILSSHSTPSSTPAPPKEIDLQLASLFLANQTELKNVRAEMDHNGKHCDKFLLRGDLHPGVPLDISWAPQPTGGQKLSVITNDAGAALAALDVTNSIRGGRLTITGQGDAAAPEWLASGKIHIKDYTVVNTPFLAKLLAITSPGGLLDALRGKGISFSEFTTQFEYSDTLLRLRQGKTNGQSLGLTFEGDINHAAVPNTLSINGTIVPLYAVNTALSDVPVVGDILSGGLIAFNYKASGPAADPSVNVNPLSAFAPGFLRDLLFDNSAVPEKTQ